MLKLLTVDDEIDICEYIKDLFSQRGYAVFTASNGADAISLVKKEKPDIVLLDILMPGMDGLEALRQIKDFDPAIKVIMVSVADDPDTKSKAAQLGADGFVKKPFAGDNLEDEVILKVSELAKESEPARILIVDDEEGIRSSLREFLSRRFECAVSEAGSGQEALAFLRKGKFDLIFLDIRMPGISGTEIIKEKKKLAYQPQIWVITRFDSEEVAHKVIEQGADDYIPKPFSLRILDTKIRDFLAGIGKYKPRPEYKL